MPHYPAPISSGSFQPFIVLLLMLACDWLAAISGPATVWAAAYYCGRHQDKERLVFMFDEDLPLYIVERTGATEITLTLPKAYWTGKKRPSNQCPTGSGLVKQIINIPQGYSIQLITQNFSYLHFPIKDQNKLVIDIFHNPAGATWHKSNKLPTAIGAPGPATPAHVPNQPASKAATAPQTNLPATPNSTPMPPAPAAITPWADVQIKAIWQDPDAPTSREPAARFPSSTMPTGIVEDEDASTSNLFKVPYTFRAPITWPDVKKNMAPAIPQSPEKPDTTAAPGKPSSDAGLTPVSPSSSIQRATIKLFGQQAPTTTLNHKPPKLDTPSTSIIDLPTDPLSSATVLLAKNPVIKTQVLPTVSMLQSPTMPGETPKSTSKLLPQTPAETRIELYITNGRTMFLNGDYAGTAALCTTLKTQQLSSAQQEEVLYLLADALLAQYWENLLSQYEAIVAAYNKAMYFNLKSPRVPIALLQLGALNLKVANMPEAQAYFNVILTEYPYYENIPMIYLHWGNYYLGHNQYQEAAHNFKTIIQNYPNSRTTLDAAINLVRCLDDLGHNRQALDIVDYINKRWPRHYIDCPTILRLIGDVAYKNGDYDRARNNYWTFFNLNPNADGMDMILARLGDIYTFTDQHEAAKALYNTVATNFPDATGGLMAQIRLAEQGVYDEPTMNLMDRIFKRPCTMEPAELYQRIVKQHPHSPLAPLAQLKLAMWLLSDRKFVEAAGAANKLLERYRDSPFIDLARTTGIKAMEQYIGTLFNEKNFTGVIKFWNDHPLLHTDLTHVVPATQLTLASSFWKTGNSNAAMRLVDPFIRAPSPQEYAEDALFLILNIFLEEQKWLKIVDLSHQIGLRELSYRAQQELDYALALSWENLDKPDLSNPLWAKLATMQDIDPTRLAYAQYFVALQAKREGNLEKVCNAAQKSLSFFLQTDDKDLEKVKDLISLLIDISDSTGYPLEALKWTVEYAKLVKKGDTEWAYLKYRTAQLYKKSSDMRRWASQLEELQTELPNTVYSRMAAFDLEATRLEQNAHQFMPIGKL